MGGMGGGEGEGAQRGFARRDTKRPRLQQLFDDRQDTKLSHVVGVEREGNSKRSVAERHLEVILARRIKQAAAALAAMRYRTP